MRLKIRKILTEELIDAVKYRDKIIKKHGKYYYQKRISRGIIEVVGEKVEENLNIKTV